MAVLDADATVCGPARVADAEGSWKRLGLRRLEGADVPDLPRDPQLLLRQRDDPSGVIATILEALEPAEHDVPRLLTPDVTHDSAHCFVPFASRRCAAGSVAR